MKITLKRLVLVMTSAGFWGFMAVAGVDRQRGWGWEWHCHTNNSFWHRRHRRRFFRCNGVRH